VLQPVFFAREDTKTPLKYAVISMVTNTVISAGGAPFIGYLAIPIGTVIASWLQVFLLWRGARAFGDAARLDPRFIARAPRLALASLALVQLVNPGAPCLMGSFASTISMQSGAPTFGTPEAAKMVLASGQLARRLGVPLHTVGTLSASKAPDAQSEQEATWSLMMAMLAGANVVNHATGWLEGGLVTSFEKTVLDADLCGKLASFFSGMDLSENAQALDAIADVGPGAHFLGSDHTQKNFRSAFYQSSMADSNSYEQWKDEGCQDAASRANGEWKKLLDSYEDPGLDPAIDEALQEFVAKRKASMPDQNYF